MPVYVGQLSDKPDHNALELEILDLWASEGTFDHRPAKNVDGSQLLGRLGIDVTAGALCQAAQATGTALEPVHQEIVRRINTTAHRW